MRRLLARWLPLACVGTVLLWAAPLHAAEGYAGSDQCEACHEDVAKDFKMTVHANAPGWSDTHGCESCHGPAAAHIEAEGTLDTIVRPAKLSPSESSKICLQCHVRNSTNFAHESAIHNLADVSCVDCHNPHSTNKHLMRREGSALCAQCHQTMAAQFQLPRAHPLPEGSDGCVSCHSPHAADSLRMKEGPGSTKCVECHFEKAGPFLYSHDPALVDGCQACHTIHGSPNRHLLKHARLINLCYQCHPGTTTPAFHSATTFLNEKCTACHTAIHGSNTNEFFLEE